MLLLQRKRPDKATAKTQNMLQAAEITLKSVIEGRVNLPTRLLTQKQPQNYKANLV
tara:strand:- start:1826 stop:1993 length:168 start_codon:yes stop_codon:yes gene_type:complete